MKLFAFPLLVSEEILGNFDPLQLLELSTLSKRASNLIHNCNLKAKPIINIEVFDESAEIRFYPVDDDEIRLHSLDEDMHDLLWRIGPNSIPQKCEPIGISTLQGTKRFVIEKDKEIQDSRTLVTYALNSRSSWISLDTALKHLYYIFPLMQVRQLKLVFIKTFNVKVGLESVKTVENMKFIGDVVNNQLKFAMENITITECFYNSAKRSMERGIQDKIECSDDIESSNTSWMSSERFSELNCHSTDLRSTIITAKDVEAYLYEWLTTEKHNKVRYMRIELYGDGEHIDFDRLGATAWDPRRRPQTWYLNLLPTDCSGFFDITKQNGMIASVFVYEDNVFKMIVWP